MMMLLVACGGGGGGGTGSTDPTCSGDTDGDGLPDCDEINLYGTSEMLADTDGDQINDYDEVIVGGAAKALLADVPRLEISIVGDATVDMDATITAACTTEATSATLSSQSSEYSRSNTRSTSETVKASAEISTTVKASFPGGASAKSTAKFSASAEATASNSSSWSGTTAQAAEQSFQNSKSCMDETVTSGGSSTIGFQLENVGAKPVILTAMTMTLLDKDPQNPERFSVLGDVNLTPAFPLNQDNNPELVIGTGAPTGTLSATVALSARRAMDLWENPSGLFFEVGYFALTDDVGTNYAFINTDVNNQTGAIVIDFGAARTDGGTPARNVVDRYLVATNAQRNPDLSPKGVTLGHALTNIIKIPYTTTTAVVTLPDSSTITRTVFESIDGVVIDQATTQLWFVSSNSKTLDDPGYTSVEDILLLPGTFIDLTLLRDSDGDGLFDREEFVYGNNPTLMDTDGDGLTDYEEVKQGWVNGYNGKKIYSSPLNKDVDGDGLDDLAERTALTDPRVIDTDGDGTPDNTDTNPIVKPPPAVIWTKASTKGWHSMGIKSNGTLWAWGWNDWGQLGLGDTLSRPTPVQVPLDADVNGVADNDWAYVVAGPYHTMAIKVDGTLWGWGADGYGRFGNGQTADGSAVNHTPVEIVVMSGSTKQLFSKVDIGVNHSLALTDLGKIYVMGHNNYGQLGIGNWVNQSVPVQMGSESDWGDIAAGFWHSLAAKKVTGTVLNPPMWLWGRNDYGELATTATGTRNTPIQAGSAPMVAANGSFSMAINDINNLYIAGSNYQEQVGYPAIYTSGSCWLQCYFKDWVIQGNTYKTMAAGQHFSTGIIKNAGDDTWDGRLYTWGNNDYGQLGIGVAGGTTYVKQLVGTGHDWAAVSGGRAHTLAIKEDGSLWAWGQGKHGALGNDSTSDSYLPSLVDNP